MQLAFQPGLGQVAANMSEGEATMRTCRRRLSTSEVLLQWDAPFRVLGEGRQ